MFLVWLGPLGTRVSTQRTEVGGGEGVGNCFLWGVSLWGFAPSFKAFHRKGAFFFTVKGPRALPKFHTEPPSRPSSPLLFWETRGGGGGSVWNLGSAQGPFTVKKKAPFRWKRFFFLPPSLAFSGFPVESLVVKKSGQSYTLIFLSLVFNPRVIPRKTTQNTKEFFDPSEPRKTPRKTEQTAENTQGTTARTATMTTKMSVFVWYARDTRAPNFNKCKGPMLRAARVCPPASVDVCMYLKTLYKYMYVLES